MSTASTNRQNDPVMRQLNIGVTILWIGIIAAVAYAVFNHAGAWSGGDETTANTENVSVCPNTQPPFTRNDWFREGYTYPPNTGVYKVTYADNSHSKITSIELVSTDITKCS